MSRISPFTLPALLLALAAGSAQAGVVDLGPLASANVYTVHDFWSQYSDTQGAIVAGGNVTLDGYSVNANNRDAFGEPGYALVAGGNLNFSNGSINNGKVYVAGSSHISSAGLNGASLSATDPLAFGAASAYAKSLSASLSQLAGTGSASAYYGGLRLSGGGSGTVDVFNIDGNSLLNADQFVLDHVTAGQTLIFNVSGGANMGFRQNGVSFAPLASYNVLFNFYQATSGLSLKGLEGSALAPYATVKDEWGVVSGNIIVDTFASHLQINADHFFKAVDVRGYAAPVPEPETYLMLLAGLGVLAVAVRAQRRRSA